jgi:hypothetical protein
MHPPRVAILGLHLEANAFAPPTTREDFTRQCWEEGEAISALARTVSHLPSELPGFYARMDATGPWVAQPIVIASAPPGGPIEQGLFQAFCDKVRIGLAAALPVDAVYIPSHGASSAGGDEDSDGTLVALVRRIVGSAVRRFRSSCRTTCIATCPSGWSMPATRWWSTAPTRTWISGSGRPRVPICCGRCWLACVRRRRSSGCRWRRPPSHC